MGRVYARETRGAQLKRMAIFEVIESVILSVTVVLVTSLCERGACVEYHVLGEEIIEGSCTNLERICQASNMVTVCYVRYYCGTE